MQIGSESELQVEEVAGQIVKGLETAVSKLDPEQQKAFASARDDQLKEVQLLLTSAGADLQQASVNGFRQSYIFASLMLLPGIMFAWMSDKRRARKHSGKSTDRSRMKLS